MSLYSAKSSGLSVLKQPGLSGRGVIKHVRFQLPSDIKDIFQKFKAGKDTNTYENLVLSIRDGEIDDSNLTSLLTEAKNCTSLLNYDLRLFVQALILIGWSHRGANVVKCYQEFVHDLVSAQPCHVKVVVDQLIKLFTCIEESDCAGSQLSEQVIQQYNNVHLLLQTTLTTVPMSDDILINSIKNNYPFFNGASHKQISYLQNILKIIQYQPDLKVNILQIAIDRLLMMDIHCPREEILQYENNSDLLYEMEVDGEEKTSKNIMKHPIANTFDLLMEVMLQYIKNQCFVEEKFLKSKSKELYNELMFVFENVILPTHECHHVQYIIFYICSFDTNLASDFLKFLWKNVTSPNVSPVIRQTSVGYVASFLARADYLPLGYLKSYLMKLNEWIHSYMENHDSTEYQADYKQHCVFYSICQAMFYLIAFRHQDLVNSSMKLVFLQSLNLAKIVSCKLNPLKYCIPSIVDNFAAVTRAYQLAYCYTIIDNNARETLPMVGRSGQFVVNSVVNMYFPFDPYVLLRTSIYFNSLYKEYSSTIKQDVLETCGKKTRLYSGTEDDDDFIGDEIPIEGSGVSF